MLFNFFGGKSRDYEAPDLPDSDFAESGEPIDEVGLDLQSQGFQPTDDDLAAAEQEIISIPDPTPSEPVFEGSDAYEKAIEESGFATFPPEGE